MNTPPTLLFSTALQLTNISCQNALPRVNPLVWLIAWTTGNMFRQIFVTFWDAHNRWNKCNRVHEAVFGFKEAGLKLGVTTWSRGSCNQSVLYFERLIECPLYTLALLYFCPYLTQSGHVPFQVIAVTTCSNRRHLYLKSSDDQKQVLSQAFPHLYGCSETNAITWINAITWKGKSADFVYCLQFLFAYALLLTCLRFRPPDPELIPPQSLMVTAIRRSSPLTPWLLAVKCQEIPPENLAQEPIVLKR